jgi:hypothetical protein
VTSLEGQDIEVFAAARAAFGEVTAFLSAAEGLSATHADLERELAARMREVTRVLYQDHLALREMLEQRTTQVVLDADGIERNRIERHRTTSLDTVFGPVAVYRIAYRGDYVHDLHLMDVALNLPSTKASHGVAYKAASEAVRGSFAEATARVRTECNIRIGPRQVEELTVAAAGDIEDFYRHKVQIPASRDTALILTFDGKGIVMRAEALRPETAKAAAAKGSNTYGSRLASGEKKGRKRMAEIAAVYDIEPVVREAIDILPEPDQDHIPEVGPVAFNKWLTGSVSQDAASVVRTAFDHAHARDPKHTRAWVVLLDGNNHQIELAKTEAKRKKVKITIIVDFIHVLEYLWKAAWCLYRSGDPAAESFVAAYGREILAGNTREAIEHLDQAAREAGLGDTARAGIDTAIGYLTAKAPYLHYDTALAAGYPIATGIIEGACRHLVKDRMDITGARWSLDGAEAVLLLRALRSNGDFDTYWTYHEAREYERNHLARFRDGKIPISPSS